MTFELDIPAIVSLFVALSGLALLPDPVGKRAREVLRILTGQAKR